MKLTLELAPSSSSRVIAWLGTALALVGFAAIVAGLALWSLTVALVVGGVIVFVVGLLLSFTSSKPDPNATSPFREGS